MKKKLFLFLLLFPICTLFSKEKIDNLKFIQIKGTVHVYGNMPFSYIGIETEDGKTFTLKADNSKIEKKINEYVGRKVLVKGVVDFPVSEQGENLKIFQMLDDGFLWVDEIKKVRN